MDDKDEKQLVRLEVQVESLKEMVHKINNNATPGFATLSQKVTELDKQVTKLDGSIEKLTCRLEESNKTPWGHLIGMGGLVLTIVSGVGGFFLTSINADSARQEKEISEIKSQLVPRVEMDNRKKSNEAIQESINKRLDNLEARRR